MMHPSTPDSGDDSSPPLQSGVGVEVAHGLLDEHGIIEEDDDDVLMEHGHAQSLSKSSFTSPSRKNKIWQGASGFGGYGSHRATSIGSFSSASSWNRSHGSSPYSNMHINLNAHSREDKLTAPPLLKRGCPKPCTFYEKDGRHSIVISTSCYHSGMKFSRFSMNTFGIHHSSANSQKADIVRYGGNEGCIYKYDLYNDSWDKVRKYDSNEFRPINHGMAVSQDRSEVFLFGGVNQIFASFSLSSQRMNGSNIYDIHTHTEMDFWYPTSCFVGRELHIFTELLLDPGPSNRVPLHAIYYPHKLKIAKHFLHKNSDDYIYRKQSMVDMDDQKSNEVHPIMYNCKVVYVKHLNEILMLNGSDGNEYIWSYSLISEKWKLFELNGKCLTLPKKNTNNFDMILVHDRILLLCYRTQKEIWAINLKASRKSEPKHCRWSRRSVKSFDGISEDCWMVNRDDEYIHFVNTLCPQHYCIWLYYLMPKRMLRRLYGPMVVSNIIRRNNSELKFWREKGKFPHEIVRCIADFSAMFN